MINCTIISPTEKNSVANADGVFVTTSTGQRGFLKGHMTATVQLRKNSLIRIKTGPETLKFTIGDNSFLTFKNNNCTILTQHFFTTTDY